MMCVRGCASMRGSAQNFGRDAFAQSSGNVAGSNGLVSVSCPTVALLLDSAFC